MASSSQDLFLNQFGKGGRETPAPLQTEAPGLPFPVNVPYVAPPNVIPDNLGDMARFSSLNQLARALGTGGVGASGIAEKLLKAAEKKREQANNNAYHQGLVDATTRAAKTRDLFSDVSQNGLMPANKHPFYQMGYQALLSQELASQYRAELVKARTENPTIDPQQLQDQIKQRYMPLMQGGRADMTTKFFIEPSLLADKDDVTAYEKAQGELFKTKMDASPAASVGSLFQSELDLIKDGRSSVPMLQEKVVKTIESSLQTSYATGWDYHNQVEKIMDVVESQATLLTNKDGTPASLKDKQAILDTLQQIKLPTGNPLLAEADFITRYAKAKENLRNAVYQEDKLAGEALDGVLKQNTQKYIIAMGDDARNGNLKTLPDYLKMVPPGEAINPTQLSQAYSALNANVTSTQEQSETTFERDLATDVHVHGLSPDAVEQKYGPMVGSGVDPGKYASALSTAAANQRHQEEELKQAPVPVGEMNVYLNQIRPKIVGQHSAGRWTGYGKDQVVTGVTKDLRAVYEQEFRRRYLQMQSQNPQGAQDPLTRMNWMQSIWNQLQGPLMRDYQHIQNQDVKNYSSFLGRNRFGSNANNTPQAPASTKPKASQTPSGFASAFPWAVRQDAFQKENQLFRQKQGKAYQWLQKVAGEKTEYHWRRYMKQNTQEPLMGIVEFMKSKGKPTFLGAPKQQQPNRR